MTDQQHPDPGKARPRRRPLSDAELARRPDAAEPARPAAAVEDGRRLPTCDFQQPRCPSCGSAELRINRTTRDPSGVTLRYMACQSCGLSFVGRFE